MRRFLRLYGKWLRAPLLFLAALVLLLGLLALLGSSQAPFRYAIF